MASKQKKQAQQHGDAAAEDSGKQAQAVEFPEAADAGDHGSGSIDILLDMDVPVTAVLGRTEIPVRRLVQLGPGSVLKLDKPVDAPVDLYLRDTRFATGQVVVVDGRFAVKIIEILGTAQPQPQAEPAAAQNNQQ